MNISKLHHITYIIFFVLASGCASKSVQQPLESEPTQAINAIPEPVNMEITKETAEQTTEQAATTVLTKSVAKVETIADVVESIPQPPTEQSTVYFDFNSADLSSDTSNVINTHIEFLKNNPDYRITLEGHTDSRGSNNFNKSLGANRAQTIKERLIKSGVKADQIRTISYGEEKPAIFGDNDDAWRSNRRAVITYHQPDTLLPGKAENANAQSQKTKDGSTMFVSE